MKRTALFSSLLATAILWLALAPGALAATSWTPEWVAPPAGRRPAPYDLSYLRGVQAIPSSVAMKAAPASYDLRALGRLTPVKDQGSYGTCWAFASLGSLESGLLASSPTVWDLSEDNLVWNAGFLNKDKYDGGGNSFMALAYLARWGGPVNESDDVYADGSRPTGLTVQRHLSEVVFVPGRTSASDNDQLKAAVMTYGAVDVGMYWAAGFYNATTHAYRYTGSEYANHDVAIVGWDDVYPASNFASPPPGDGAFIMRNSWGSNWGERGYFYASYYDTVIGYDYYNMAFASAGPADDYQRVYQYDPLGYYPEAGPTSSGTTSSCANVFTAAASEGLAAVGIYTPYPGCAYEVLYAGAGGKPSSSALQSLTSGTMATAGYHVVALPATVPLTSGQQFTVALKLTVPDPPRPVPLYYYDYLPVERPIPGYSDATSNPGESYVNTAGSTWRDITSISSLEEANVCLKAFTTGLPRGTFSVNDKAAYTRSSAVQLRSRIVGATDMRFRDADGTWTDWETYTATTNWTLPSGDGAKTVEAEFRNAKGTTGRSDAISLDSQRPTTKAPRRTSVRRYQYVRLYYKVLDAAPCAAKATVTIKLKTLGGTTKKTLRLGQRYVNSLRSYRFRCSLAKRTYRYWVYATDAAGNRQATLGRNYLYVK